MRVDHKQLVEAAKELRQILIEKEVTPQEAENIVSVLLDLVKKDNSDGKKRYMMEGKFGEKVLSV